MTSDLVISKQPDQHIRRARIGHLAQREDDHLSRPSVPTVRSKLRHRLIDGVVGQHLQCAADGPFYPLLD